MEDYIQVISLKVDNPEKIDDRVETFEVKGPDGFHLTFNAPLKPLVNLFQKMQESPELATEYLQEFKQSFGAISE
jgi:hypothetical protein